MFDFLRNLTKTEEEKQQERLNAYLDYALTPQERQAFEEQLQADTALQADLEQLRRIKDNVSHLPRVRAPRNFTLDPAAYGRPASQPAFRLYPLMRAGGPAETLADAPEAVTSFGLEETADSTVEEPAAEEPAPAASPEILSEEAGETAADEEAMEEMAEEETAEEAELAPPAEPQEAEEAAADDNGAAQATQQPLAETEEGAAADGFITTTQIPAPTTTLRLSPTATVEPGSETQFFSETQEIPAVEPTADVDAEQSRPISTLNLLQIGLGILFLVLLAATLLVRRQL